MKPNIPMALGAGTISAVVFASATTGPTLARMVLLALVTLPVALAGYAYGARTALMAASLGTLILVLATTLAAGALFGLALVFPAALLVYLALLHRETGPGETQWFPIGWIIVVTSLLAATLVAIGLNVTGTDPDKLRSIVKASIDTVMRTGFGGMPGGATLSQADLARATDTVVQLIPAASAAFWMACMLVCQWLAARVALMSGQLARPWPDLAAFQLPLGTPALLGAALAASLVLDGLPRLMAMGFAGALYAVYALLGLAILHHITRGLSWRGAALAAVYVVLLVLNTGATLMLALLGLLDSFIQLRRPTIPTNPET